MEHREQDGPRRDEGLLGAAEVTEVYETLSRTYPTFDQSDDPWMTNGLSSTPFKALVSAALSTVTTTSRVVTAALKLYDRVSTFQELADLDDDELRDMIRTVAHYNRKTQYLKRMSRQIIDEHGGQVPHDRDALMALPGIGRKVTDLMLNFEFGELTIGVDTHVHRVVNRIGMVATTTHEKTADALMDVTPDRFTPHAHEWLIQHGATVCRSRAPRCGGCPLSDVCHYAHARAA